MNRLQVSARTSLIVLVSFLACASPANSDPKKILKHATEDVALNISRLNLKKIYVPDFLDASEKRTDRSAFWSAVLSKTLSELAHDFAVLNRASVQKSYENAGITPVDLQNPQSLLKVGETNGADAIILGTVTESSSHSLRLDLSVREAGSGKELFGSHYGLSKERELDGWFPAVSDPAGRTFYFPGYDDVTMPKCIHCPDPGFTDVGRRTKCQGNVLLSAIFTARGTVEQIIVLQNPGCDFDKASVEAMRKWEITPAKNSDGNPVSVRTVVETIFKLF